MRRAVPSLLMEELYAQSSAVPGCEGALRAEQCRPWVLIGFYAQSSAVPGCRRWCMRRAVPSLGV